MGSNRVAEPSLVNSIRSVYPDLRAIEEAGEAVASLVAHPGWDHVNRLLAVEVEQIDRQLDGISLANPPSYESLCAMHGRRGGLRYALEAADAIVAVAEAKLAEQRVKHERGARSPQEVH